MNYTYIVQCADGTLYTGWTNCLQKRLKAHNEGKAGAKYTRSKRPVKLVYYEGFETKEEAMRREYAIKQLTRKQKLKNYSKHPGSFLLALLTKLAILLTVLALGFIMIYILVKGIPNQSTDLFAL